MIAMIDRMNRSGKVHIKFLFWPSLIISLLLTLLLNLIF
jgi:hypothetical protein